MTQKENFNELIEWKETFRKAIQASFLCEGCKIRMDDAIKRIDVVLDKIIEESKGVLL